MCRGSTYRNICVFGTFFEGVAIYMLKGRVDTCKNKRGAHDGFIDTNIETIMVSIKKCNVTSRGIIIYNKVIIIVSYLDTINTNQTDYLWQNIKMVHKE